MSTVTSGHDRRRNQSTLHCSRSRARRPGQDTPGQTLLDHLAREAALCCERDRLADQLRTVEVAIAQSRSQHERLIGAAGESGELPLWLKEAQAP